jgi:four helix bundle protein
MHDFKKLTVWQKTRHFVKDLYLLTQKFPNEEKFGLMQQIRRAAVSIFSNIAKGAGRNTDADFAHFVDMANGSAFEVETQLHIAIDLGYILQQEFENIASQLQEIERMLYNLRKSLTRC